MKFVGMAFLLVGASGLTLAGTPNVPEVGPASAVAALALISGAMLVIRGRRRK